jgi:hypothetical protein
MKPPLFIRPLPRKSPWLNRIEPKGVHGTRAMAAPERKVNADELPHRLCAYYACALLDPLAQKSSDHALER